MSWLKDIIIMEKYRKVVSKEQPLDPNEIRIKAENQSLFPYLSYANRHFSEGNKRIVIKALGNAVFKAINAAELIKRKFAGLHQINEVQSHEVQETFEPYEEGLDTINRSRTLTMLVITLSMDPLDTSHYGYQPPLGPDDVEPYQADKPARRGAPKQYRGPSPRGYRGGPRGGPRGGGYRGGRGSGGHAPAYHEEQQQHYEGHHSHRGGPGGHRGGGGGYNRPHNNRGGAPYQGGRFNPRPGEETQQAYAHPPPAQQKRYNEPHHHEAPRGGHHQPRGAPKQQPYGYYDEAPPRPRHQQQHREEHYYEDEYAPRGGHRGGRRYPPPRQDYYEEEYYEEEDYEPYEPAPRYYRQRGGRGGGGYRAQYQAEGGECKYAGSNNL